VVRDSVLGDGNDTASMAVDVSAGGDVLVENNRIVQAASGDNPNIVYYSAGRGGEPGEVTLRGNEIVNGMDKGTLVGVGLTDQPETEVRLENNTISDPSGALKLSDAAYTSAGNTLNGETLANGWFDPDWPMLTRDLPEALGEVPPPAMEDSWPSSQGKYLLAGWGEHTLEGTDGRDVLEARQKGLKTLQGGDGDDVYLNWGQSTVVERADEGEDWIVKTGGGWAYTLPDHVEGFAIHGSRAYQQAVTGNDQDNVFVGATGGGNQFRGGAGDDVMYGGGGSGNSFSGGSGYDRYVLAGNQEDFTISSSGRFHTITYSDGGTDRIDTSVEAVVFDDATLDLTKDPEDKQSPTTPVPGGEEDDKTEDDKGVPSADLPTVLDEADGTFPIAPGGADLPLWSGESEWTSDGGVYLSAGWGKHSLVGTSGRDLLEARTKGLKTLEGGAGDDVYLPWGQAEIVEEADGGFDWVVEKGGSWAETLPDNVEGYILLGDSATQHINGNALDNVLIGGRGSGERFDGGAGDDVMFGGGTGGDRFSGGAGEDTVMFAGSRDDYEIETVARGQRVTYDNGNVDLIDNTVETLTFLADDTGDPLADDKGVPSADLPTVLDEADGTFPIAPGGADLPLWSGESEWTSDGGVYLSAGWGKHSLVGTSGRDLLEARTKGLKTLEGGAGDDVYLPWGQAEIVEEADGGFDWVVEKGGSWAETLPDNVEGYILLGDSATQHINGNALDNVLIGGRGSGERFDGGAGDDVMFGGGTGGDRFSGGAGEDTVMFAGSRDDYEIETVAGGERVTYDDGNVDFVESSVEALIFSGMDTDLFWA